MWWWVTMPEVIKKVGIKREANWLYYLDSNGDIRRVTMQRAGKPYNKKIELVAECGIKRRAGFLYFINKAGDVCEAKLQRGGRKDGAKCKRKMKVKDMVMDHEESTDDNLDDFSKGDKVKPLKKKYDIVGDADPKDDEQLDEDVMPKLKSKPEKKDLEKMFEEMENSVDNTEDEKEDSDEEKDSEMH